MEQIRKAVTDQGFAPKEAVVEAIGQIRSVNGKLQFAVTNSKDVYELAPTPDAVWSGQVGKQVTVHALVPAVGGEKPKEIQITEFAGQANR
jgi:hypothetical protein